MCLMKLASWVKSAVANFIKQFYGNPYLFIPLADAWFKKLSIYLNTFCIEQEFKKTIQYFAWNSNILTLKDAESTLRSGDRLPFLKEWSKCSQTSWLFQEWCWAQGKRVILGISWMTVQKMDRVRQKFQKILRRKS